MTECQEGGSGNGSGDPSSIVLEEKERKGKEKQHICLFMLIIGRCQRIGEHEVHSVAGTGADRPLRCQGQSPLKLRLTMCQLSRPCKICIISLLSSLFFPFLHVLLFSFSFCFFFPYPSWWTLALPPCCFNKKLLVNFHTLLSSLQLDNATTSRGFAPWHPWWKVFALPKV